ncbi:uncharacterized protein LOC128147621 [Harpia harpyja]|uniref:uncharacterized protein LOC128147621 n=1 Tax=Harpia harpyja TaxID=202280 RepID=UPI0022B0D816|nr:uncharacterized protein LOC128147621 [Harpia harpyja]
MWLLHMVWTALRLWRNAKRPQGQGSGQTASTSMGTGCLGKHAVSKYELLCLLEAKISLLVRCLRHTYRLRLKELRHQYSRKLEAIIALMIMFLHGGHGQRLDGSQVTRGESQPRKDRRGALRTLVSALIPYVSWRRSCSLFSPGQTAFGERQKEAQQCRQQRLRRLIEEPAEIVRRAPHRQQAEENHQELHGAIQQLNTKEEKPCALLAAWLKEDEQENEALHQDIRHLEQALEEEEACHYHRKKEAETLETVLPEVVEAQLERDVLARRRGFCYWLQTLLLLLVSLELVISFAVAAAVLYASCYHPGLFCRLLPRVLPEEAYADLAYAVGKILPAVSEGLLPF